MSTWRYGKTMNPKPWRQVYVTQWHVSWFLWTSCSDRCSCCLNSGIGWLGSAEEQKEYILRICEWIKLKVFQNWSRSKVMDDLFHVYMNSKGKSQFFVFRGISSTSRISYIESSKLKSIKLVHSFIGWTDAKIK